MKKLPAGFRFHPTDEELILHYLSKKLSCSPLPVSIIADVNIYKFDPWDLPAKAEFGEKEWYFFSPRDRKYPNGARPNRAAASGYWKATGTDKTIVSCGVVIGVKKALVFYKGRPPKGVKTNWIMHEYRLRSHPSIPTSTTTSFPSSMRLDNWVLCRIYKKTYVIHPPMSHPEGGEDEEDVEKESSNNPNKSCSFSNLLDAMDYSILSSLLSDSYNTPGLSNATSSIIDPPMPFSHVSPNTCDNYAIQTQSTIENRLKRHIPTHSDHLLPQPKKYCTFIQSEATQSNVITNPVFLNHQLFWSPELQR